MVRSSGLSGENSKASCRKAKDVRTEGIGERQTKIAKAKQRQKTTLHVALLLHLVFGVRQLLEIAFTFPSERASLSFTRVENGK